MGVLSDRCQGRPWPLGGGGAALAKGSSAGREQQTPHCPCRVRAGVQAPRGQAPGRAGLCLQEGQAEAPAQHPQSSLRPPGAPPLHLGGSTVVPGPQGGALAFIQSPKGRQQRDSLPGRLSRRHRRARARVGSWKRGFRRKGASVCPGC